MALPRHSVGTYWETSSNNLSGNTLSQLFQLAEPLWTDPGLKSGICVRKLISLLRNGKKTQVGNELLNILA